MKSRLRLFGVLIFVLALVSLAGYAEGKYIPKANEECYGTWINEKGMPQKVVIFDGGWGDYILIADTVPTYNDGTEEIESKW